MVKNSEDMFIRFDRIHERDRQTNRRTPHDGMAALMHTIARQKLFNSPLTRVWVTSLPDAKPGGHVLEQESDVAVGVDRCYVDCVTARAVVSADRREIAVIIYDAVTSLT